MIARRVIEFLKKREFVYVGTCDFKGNPNVVPKFFLRQTGRNVYLIDNAHGKTLDNIRANPRMSIAFMDVDALVGYKIAGRVKIIERGSAYEKIMAQMRRKSVVLSARRIAEGVRRERHSHGYELEFPEDCVIYQMRMQEVVEVDTAGNILKERVRKKKRE
ncbi:MAG TPA: pyridoxamine 5'-phosphate oxidase family protein [bacterium]|nr:pyridoxamine 5'-phosphate oxidase family protein [bacterium]